MIKTDGVVPSMNMKYVLDPETLSMSLLLFEKYCCRTSLPGGGSLEAVALRGGLKVFWSKHKLGSSGERERRWLESSPQNLNSLHGKERRVKA